MNDLEQKVFYLWCYEELSVRQIGKELNISKSAAHRIKTAVGNIIKDTLEKSGWDKE